MTPGLVQITGDFLLWFLVSFMSVMPLASFFLKHPAKSQEKTGETSVFVFFWSSALSRERLGLYQVFFIKRGTEKNGKGFVTKHSYN